MLRASVLPAASSAVQSQKRPQNAIKRQCKHICDLSDSGRAVPVQFLQPYLGARTYSITAGVKCDESSRP